MVRLPLILLVVGCSDYTVNEKKPEAEGFDTGDPVATVPDLEVSPELIAETAVCAWRTVPVTLSNTGSGSLEITGLILEGDATATLPSTPLVIAPGESEGIPVQVGVGSATLTVESDDPDTPEVVVPISGTGDEPPSLTILAPSAGDVVDPGSTLSLSMSVTDDADAPSDLVLAWASDVDGVIGGPTADSGGLAVLDWNPATAGAHVLTASATDSCGNVTTATVDVCQQEGYTEDSIDLTSWHFEGTANWDSTNGWLELTEPVGYSVGSAFQTSAAVTGDAVTIEALFFIGGGTGADGLALTALDINRMTGYLGSAGGCLGYGYGGGCDPLQPALPGWSIEIDAYQNSGWDISEDDHVAFTFDGSMDRYQAYSVLPEMEDTGWHTLSVNVAAPHVLVEIDGVAYIDQDIAGYYSFPAYVGFSASTGGSTNYHLIDALEVTEYACPE